ncbi:PepSY-associated TM helix domain-containing protein [Sphingomonas sp. MMO-176]
MTGALRRNMAWIHGWLGLVGGWLLFVMFLTGTASYFRPEITRWMQPELPWRTVAPAAAAQAAVSYLTRVGPDDRQWYVFLPDARTAITRVFVTPNPAAPASATRATEILLDPTTGQPLRARDTRGGEHFYRFHFQLQLPYPWGRWLAGVCAMFMLGAIVSGVITHKRIFADLFTLRWNKGQRSWLDAHNVAAVLALPYHAMITYTGLLTLITLYMPWPVAANYTDPATFAQAIYGTPPDEAASGRRVPTIAVGALAADAARRWGAPPALMIVSNPGDAAAQVTFARSARDTIGARATTLTYAGVTGRLLREGGGTGPALSTAGVMLGLHVAQFAGPALRWTLFLLGLTGTTMVGTGLLLWTSARRRPGAAPFSGLRLVERLNIATIVGFPVGMAAYLLANRLIPADLAGRADLEVQAMFWTWGVVALAQLVRPARRAWREGFLLAAIAYAAVPLTNTLTTARGLPRSLVEGDMAFAAFDIAMLAIASLFALAAWRAGKAAGTKPRRKSRSETIHV